VLHLNLSEEGKTKQPSLTLSVKFILKGHEFVSYRGISKKQRKTNQKTWRKTKYFLLLFGFIFPCFMLILQKKTNSCPFKMDPSNNVSQDGLPLSPNNKFNWNTSKRKESQRKRFAITTCTVYCLYIHFLLFTSYALPPFSCSQHTGPPLRNRCGTVYVAAWKVGTGQVDSSWQDSRVGSTAEASTSTYFTVGPGHLTGRLAWEEGMGHWSMYDMSLQTATSHAWKTFPLLGRGFYLHSTGQPKNLRKFPENIVIQKAHEQGLNQCPLEFNSTTLPLHHRSWCLINEKY